MLKWTRSVRGHFVTLIEVCIHIIASISDEKLLKHEIFMISLFEPLITKIELSKAQKSTVKAFPKKRPSILFLFLKDASWSFPIPNNIVNFTL